MTDSITSVPEAVAALGALPVPVGDQPQPPCHPVAVVAGDQLCVEAACDHEHSAEGGANGLEDSYCDEVREETVCGTHSRFEEKPWGEELVEAEPWPCRYTEAATS